MAFDAVVVVGVLDLVGRGGRVVAPVGQEHGPVLVRQVAGAAFLLVEFGLLAERGRVLVVEEDDRRLGERSELLQFVDGEDVGPKLLVPLLLGRALSCGQRQQAAGPGQDQGDKQCSRAPFCIFHTIFDLLLDVFTSPISHGHGPWRAVLRPLPVRPRGNASGRDNPLQKRLLTATQKIITICLQYVRLVLSEFCETCHLIF
ncbi:hypothetical protein DSECCO2_599450 [anaerobic digester metagenome]